MSLFTGDRRAYTPHGSILPHPHWISVETRSGSKESRWAWLLMNTRQIETYALPCLLSAGLTLSLVNTFRITCTFRGHFRQEAHMSAYCLATSLCFFFALLLELPAYVSLGGKFMQVAPFLASLLHWFWLLATWQLITVFVYRVVYSRRLIFEIKQFAKDSFISRTASYLDPPHPLATTVAILLVTMTLSIPRIWQFYPLVNRISGNTTNWYQLGQMPQDAPLAWFYHVIGFIGPLGFFLTLTIVLCTCSRILYTVTGRHYQLFEGTRSVMDNGHFATQESDDATIFNEEVSSNMSSNYFCLLLMLVNLPLCSPLPLLSIASTTSGDWVLQLHKSSTFLVLNALFNILFHMGQLLTQLSILIGLINTEGTGSKHVSFTLVNTNQSDTRIIPGVPSDEPYLDPTVAQEMSVFRNRQTDISME